MRILETVVWHGSWQNPAAKDQLNCRKAVIQLRPVDVNWSLNPIDFEYIIWIHHISNIFCQNFPQPYDFGHTFWSPACFHPPLSQPGDVPAPTHLGLGKSSRPHLSSKKIPSKGIQVSKLIASKRFRLLMHRGFIWVYQVLIKNDATTVCGGGPFGTAILVQTRIWDPKLWLTNSKPATKELPSLQNGQLPRCPSRALPKTNPHVIYFWCFKENKKTFCGTFTPGLCESWWWLRMRTCLVDPTGHRRWRSEDQSLGSWYITHQLSIKRLGSGDIIPRDQLFSTRKTRCDKSSVDISGKAKRSIWLKKNEDLHPFFTVKNCSGPTAWYHQQNQLQTGSHGEAVNVMIRVRDHLIPQLTADFFLSFQRVLLNAWSDSGNPLN